METRPLSKEKRWRLVEILKRASTAPPLPDGEAVQPKPTQSQHVRTERPTQEHALS